jgi:serine protease Do
LRPSKPFALAVLTGASCIAIASAAALGAVGCGASSPGGATPPAAAAAADAGPKAPPAHQTPAEIAAHSTPAIVSIRTEHSLGTGFVVDKSGLIATNLHVIAGRDRLVVILPDQRQFPILEVVSHDPNVDLAIVRIGAHDLASLSLGDSDAMHAGDPIVAIGHPLGLEDTVSNGLISAVRALDGVTVLQISAPIAPGSSGGPIFNERGEVIGVCTALVTGGQNLSFGVPSKYVRALLEAPEPMSIAAFAAETTPPESTDVAVVRKVPQLKVSALDGCNAAALDLVLQTIGEAIEVGAPLYNKGNHAGCYHIYEGAAADLDRKLPRTCTGPGEVLKAGRTRAASLPTPTEQAWAMRDSFDGLISVIVRKRRGK